MKNENYRSHIFLISGKSFNNVIKDVNIVHRGVK